MPNALEHIIANLERKAKSGKLDRKAKKLVAKGALLSNESDCEEELERRKRKRKEDRDAVGEKMYDQAKRLRKQTAFYAEECSREYDPKPKETKPKRKSSKKKASKDDSDDESVKASRPKGGKKRVIDDLDSDSETEGNSQLEELKRKHLKGRKQLGGKRMKLLEDDELKRSEDFIAEESSDSDVVVVESKKEGLLASLLRRSNNFELNHGRDVTDALAVGRAELEERRQSDKKSAMSNAIERVQTDRKDRAPPAVATSVTNNSSSNNSNNVSNSNNVTNVTYNISGGGSSGAGAGAGSFAPFAQPIHMPMIGAPHNFGAPHPYNFGALHNMYSLPYDGSSNFAFNQPSALSSLSHGITFPQYGRAYETTSAPWSHFGGGSAGHNAGGPGVPSLTGVSISQLVRKYLSAHEGDRSREWIDYYRKALVMYQNGWPFIRGYNSHDDGTSRWYHSQQSNYHALSDIQQELLRRIGI